jgi:hypothetical protein
LLWVGHLGLPILSHGGLLRLRGRLLLVLQLYLRQLLVLLVLVLLLLVMLVLHLQLLAYTAQTQ